MPGSGRTVFPAPQTDLANFVAPVSEIVPADYASIALID